MQLVHPSSERGGGHNKLVSQEKFMNRLQPFALLAALATVLAACGGGTAAQAGPPSTGASRIATASVPAPVTSASAASAGAGASLSDKAPGPYTPNGSVTVAAGQPVDIQALASLKWQPNTLMVTPNEKVTLNISNTSATAHDFRSPSLKVEMTDVSADKTTTLSFTAPAQPGVYQFWCGVPGHAEAGMVGEVIVK
jgi:uncharacterized cupredoxin-like copper-binding protein